MKTKHEKVLNPGLIFSRLTGDTGENIVVYIIYKDLLFFKNTKIRFFIKTGEIIVDIMG